MLIDSKANGFSPYDYQTEFVALVTCVALKRIAILTIGQGLKYFKSYLQSKDFDNWQL